VTSPAWIARSPPAAVASATRRAPVAVGVDPATGPECLDPCLEAREEAVEQEDRVDRAPAGGRAEARHRRRQVDREAVGGPVRVEPDPDDDARRGGPESDGLAEDATQLADDATPEPGPGMLRRIGHREAHGGGQAPGVLGCEPRRAEAEREEQRAPGRRDPGSARAATACGLLIGEREAYLRGARFQPLADHVLGRRDPREALLPGEERCHRRPVSRPVPASPRRCRAGPARRTGPACRCRAGPARRARMQRGARWRRSRAGPPRSCR